MTLSKRKLEETSVQNELLDENKKVEGNEPSEVPEKEKKRVRLTIGVNPVERQEKKKKVMTGGGENQATNRGRGCKYNTCDGTWLR